METTTHAPRPELLAKVLLDAAAIEAIVQADGLAEPFHEFEKRIATLLEAGARLSAVADMLAVPFQPIRELIRLAIADGGEIWSYLHDVDAADASEERKPAIADALRHLRVAARVAFGEVSISAAEAGDAVKAVEEGISSFECPMTPSPFPFTMADQDAGFLEAEIAGCRLLAAARDLADGSALLQYLNDQDDNASPAACRCARFLAAEIAIREASAAIQKSAAPVASVPRAPHKKAKRKLDMTALEGMARDYLKGKDNCKATELAEYLKCAVGNISKLPAWRTHLQTRRRPRVVAADLSNVASPESTLDELLADQQADERAASRRSHRPFMNIHDRS